MATNAASVLNVDPSGSDQNGCGFSLAGNTYAVTDLAGTNANTTTPSVSSATYTFVAGDVGDYLYVAAGTNWKVGLYPIVSVAGGAATLGQPDPQSGSFTGCASVASPASGSATIMRIRRTAAFVNIDNSTVTTSITGSVLTFTAGYTVKPTDVGNWVQFLTGTNLNAAPNYKQITAVNVAGGTWTLDSSPISAGTTTNATAKMGGAAATPGQACQTGVLLASQSCFIKSGTYLLGATTANTASVSAQATTPFTRVCGYKTLWGDITYGVNASSRPILRHNANSVTALNFSAATGGFWVENLAFDGNGKTLATGVVCNASTVYNCSFKTFGNHGVSEGSTATTVVCCEFANCSAQSACGITVGVVVGCHFHDISSTAVAMGGTGGYCGYNLFVNCSQAVTGTRQAVVIENNTVYNSGGTDAIELNSGSACYQSMVRNNLVAKSLLAVNGQAAGWAATPLWDGNGFWSNTTNRSNLDDAGTTNPVHMAGPYANVNDVVASADPFVKASVAVADLTVDGSNNLKVTSGSYTFVAGDVGATLYVTTNSGGWNGPAEFTIASVAGGAAVLNASPGAVSSTLGNWYFNNFALNASNPGGAQVKGKGVPGSFPGTASNLPSIDMGAVQSAGSGGGGGGGSFILGG